MAKDPVCGMEVDESKVPKELSYEHLGRNFYFCSRQCKEAFKASPQQHVTTPVA